VVYLYLDRLSGRTRHASAPTPAPQAPANANA
jgi:hypothetical protein